MNNRIIILLTAAMSGGLTPIACGEGAINDSLLPGSYTMTATNDKIEIPFEIYRGDIRFNCEVNGHQVQMLLDDGYMWDQLLFWGSPAVDTLGLVYDGQIGIGNEDSEQIQSKTASGISVRFPGVEFTEQTAVVTPYSSGTAGMWSGSVGQISATFFKHFVVDINFDRMIITLIKPEAFESAGHGDPVSWQPLGFGPWSIPATLTMEDGRTVSMLLLMDLGYNDQVQVVVGGEHGISLPKAKLPASLGINIQRVETRGYFGRLPEIEIGGYKIPDLLTSFVSEDYADHAVYEGMIGLELLSRFNLVFDYHRQRLFLNPNKTFGNPFESNMTGFELGRSFQGYSVVKKVHEHSAAAEAGVQVGDKIHKINNKPVSEYDSHELRSVFQQAGAEIKVLLERNGNRQETAIVLRRVI